jgi:hypothetical protein
MMQLFGLPGPHDVPFAAPLVVACVLGFVIGFAILKLLDGMGVGKDSDKH